MVLAARGLRDMDAGPQPIGEPRELGQVKKQARAVHLKSLGTAAILTLILFALL